MLMILGVFWSNNPQHGWIIVSKQWSWLLIPLLLAVSSQTTSRTRLLWSLSIGLGLHLLLCLAQSQGIPLPVEAPGGSTPDDPAGLIGHISFGLIYGIWAAWLLHLGWLQHGYRRYALWSVASISSVMVFAAQGRSGYLIIIMLSLVMIWKLWLQHLQPRLIVGIAAALLLVATTIAMGPARDRIEWTWNSLQSFSHGDFEHAEARISMWYAAWEGWKAHPWFGVGTGGFEQVSIWVATNHPNIRYDGKISAMHPHQMYLMDLVRWGPIGLLLLLLFLSQWIRIGWQANWQQPHHLLMALSGIAIAIHGLSAPSLEEYHASMYCGIFLAIGMASMKLDKG